MQMPFQMASRGMGENHRPLASSYSIVTDKDVSKGRAFNGKTGAELLGCEGRGGEEEAIVPRRHERQVVVSDRRVGGKETQRASEAVAHQDPPHISAAVQAHGKHP